MRTKILLLLSLFVFLAMDVNSKQLETEATLREIQLKATTRISPRSTTMRTTSLQSSVKEIAPITYLVGNAVAVNFASAVSNASIVVSNAETGEVVHHELFTCSSPTTVLVDLEGCESGLYYINITTSSTEYNGEFIL